MPALQLLAKNFPMNNINLTLWIWSWRNILVGSVFFVSLKYSVDIQTNANVYINKNSLINMCVGNVDVFHWTLWVGQSVLMVKEFYNHTRWSSCTIWEFWPHKFVSGVLCLFSVLIGICFWQKLAWFFREILCQQRSTMS